MAHNVESMFTVAKLPWHYRETKDRVAVLQEAPKTVDDLLKVAGLDWTVEQTPVFTLSQAGLKSLNAAYGAKPADAPADWEPDLNFSIRDLVQMQNADGEPSHWANVRRSDWETLGIVGPQYEVFQPAQCADLMMALLGTEVKLPNGKTIKAHFETGGSLRKGRIMWLLAKIPHDMKLADGSSPESYAMLGNSFDGSQGLRIMRTNVRTECNNTFDLAEARAKTKFSWAIKHSGKIHELAALAREQLGFLVEATQRDVAVANAMLNFKPFTKDMFVKVASDIYPLPKKTDTMTDEELDRVNARRERVLEVWMQSPNLADIRDTAWGAFNAVTEFADHGRRYRSGESRMMALLSENGTGRNFKQKALSSIVKTAKLDLSTV